MNCSEHFAESQFSETFLSSQSTYNFSGVKSIQLFIYELVTREKSLHSECMGSAPKIILRLLVRQFCRI